jgi:hypothetical protein
MFTEVRTGDPDRIISEVRRVLELPDPPSISIRKSGDMFIATLADGSEPPTWCDESP